MTHEQVINLFKHFVDNNTTLISQSEEKQFLGFETDCQIHATASQELVNSFSEYLKASETEKFLVYYSDATDRQYINEVGLEYSDATFLGTIETLPTEKRYNRKSVASELPRVGEIIKSPYGTTVEVISVNPY